MSILTEGQGRCERMYVSKSMSNSRGRNSDISGPFNAKASKKLKRRLGMIIVDGNENTLNGQVRTAAFTDTPATSLLRNSRLFIRESIAQA